MSLIGYPKIPRPLADRRRQDVHLAAVLGHGAASDADAVVEKAVADLSVAKRAAGGALIADDLLDHVFDAQRGGEQVAHGDDLARRQHDELAGDGAAACRLMDAQRVRHLAASQWP